MTTLRFFLSLMFFGLVAAPATGAPPKAATAEVPADQADEQLALSALQQLLGAFGDGNYTQVESLIEPQMTGYTPLLQALRQAGHTQRQLRINLTDTRNLVSRDVAVIRTRWEKRYLLLPALAAQRKVGNTTFVMHRDAGVWRLSAMAGESPFLAE